MYVNENSNIFKKEIRTVNFSRMNLGTEKSNNSRNWYQQTFLKNKTNFKKNLLSLKHKQVN